MPQRAFAPSSSGAAGSLPDAEALGARPLAILATDGRAESAKEDLLLRQPPGKRVLRAACRSGGARAPLAPILMLVSPAFPWGGSQPCGLS